ncbi:MAG: hypothetical protein KatS3mg003_1181 [Candidatus Nitrosocaldaceae archaeon]|nr:MAG: hypothetical protein KatS3mg003_1181 [Candidatus Nitrosocaldaceae archaeon]
MVVKMSLVKKGSILILLLLSIIVVNQFPIKTYAQEVSIDLRDKKIHFITPSVKIVFDINSKGRITELANQITGQELEIVRPYNLFLIDGEDYDLSSSSAKSFAYNIINDTLFMDWTFDGVNVTAKFEYDSNTKGIAAWLDIDNNNSTLVIKEVAFPYIGGIDKISGSKPDIIAVPDGLGYSITNVLEKLKSGVTSISHKYPGGLSMQFFTLYQENIGGFYFAAHDPRSMVKGIFLSGKTFDVDAVKLTWEHFPFLLDNENDLRLLYPVIISAYKGNWEDAAELYREWALKQRWVKGLIENRDGIPSWLKELELIWKVSSYNTDNNGTVTLRGITADQFPEYTDILLDKLSVIGLNNTNILIEWWGWNQYGFDNGYPEYFPPRDGEALKDAIDYAHSKGLKVMLYFNGYIVDIDTQTFKENKKYMVVNEHGEYHLSTLFNGRTFAVPNPRYEWWKDTLTELAMKAVKDYDIDAMYLDQMLTAPARIDYNYTIDGKVIVGGYGWSAAESKILKSIKENTKPYKDIILATERANEVYIPYIDIFWTGGQYTSMLRNLLLEAVPLFTYVYHGYTFESVRSDYILAVDKDLYNWAVSNAIVTGTIPGGVVPTIRQLDNIDDESLLVLKQAINLKRVIPELLYYKAIKPPLLTTNDYVFTSERFLKDFNLSMTDDAVVIGSFINTNEILLVSNRTPQEQSVTINDLDIIQSIYSLLEDSSKEYKVSNDGIEIVLKPYEVIYITK